MTLDYGVIAPHPPIMIPAIGGGEIEKVRNSVVSMELIADEISKRNPETLIFTSPHTISYYDTFIINDKKTMSGSFAPFGYPDISFSMENDLELGARIEKIATSKGIPLTPASILEGKEGVQVDHGVLVPYYFISKNKDYKIVSISISGLSLEKHFELGQLIGEVCADEERKITFVSSGDLSHGLTLEAPAGYMPRGAEFDKVINDIVSSGEMAKLKEIDQALIEAAGECGLRSFVILAGALSSREYKTQINSYEAPFGVGYMVAQLKIGNTDE